MDRKLPAWLWLVLLVAALLQTGFVLQHYAPLAVRVYKDIGKHALWRGAAFYEGAFFADYVEFILANTPQNARVVLPPTGYGPLPLSASPIMQFFLAPREVLNCTTLECGAQVVRDERTYILISHEFPPVQRYQGTLAYTMFNEKLGVIPPDGGFTGAGQTLPRFNSLLQIGGNVLQGAAWLAGLWLAGVLLAAALLPARLSPAYPESSSLLVLTLGWGLGLGVFSLGLAALSLLGIPIGQESTLAAWAAILTGGAGLGLLARRRVSQHWTALRQCAWRTWAWFLPVLALGVLGLYLSIGMGYYSDDGILLWGVKGSGIAITGSLADIWRWGTTTLAYPLHIPLSIASLNLLAGSALPASKLLFGGYYLFILALVFAFLLQAGLKPSTAGMVSFLFASTPLLFYHATIAYANLAAAFYLLGGGFVFLAALPQNTESTPLPNPRALALSGLLFALAAWTRPEFLGMAVVGLLALGVFSFPWRLLRQVGVLWAALLAPLAGYGLFWAAVYRKAYASAEFYQSDLAGEMISQFLAGQFHLGEGWQVLAYGVNSLFTFSVWGGLGFASLGLVFFGVWKRLSPAARSGTGKWVPSTGARLAILGGLFLLAACAIYYVTSFDQSEDLSWWLTTGFDRIAMPGILLLFLAGVLGAVGVKDLNGN